MAGSFSEVHIQVGLQNVAVLRNVQSGAILLIINNHHRNTSEEVVLTTSDARKLFGWLKEAAQ